MRRAVAAAGVLQDLALENGQNLTDFLLGTGLQPLDLDDASQTLSVHQECTLICNLLRHASHVEGLGLEAGRRYKFLQLGPLGQGLIHACTVREGFQFAEQFAELGLTLVRLTNRPSGPHGQHLRVCMAAPPAPPGVHRFAVERMVAVVHTLTAALLGRRLQALRMEFAFPPPRNTNLYAEFGAREVLYGQAESAMVFSSQDVDLPLPRGNKQAVANAEAQCRQALQLARWQPGLSARVRDLVYLQPDRMADMRAVAASLCMSERTLRRRLQEEGATFAEISDDARRTMAEHLLSLPRLSIEQIASQLGYAEAASFIHAFKRWRGQTPHAFRLNLGRCGVA